MSDSVDSAEEQNNPEGADRPEWLPENFDNPEDFVKSYRAAQDKIREQGSQLNAITDNYSELSDRLEQLQNQGQQPQADPAEANAQWYAMYENDPLGTVTLLAQQIARQELQAGQAEQQQQTKAQAAAQAELVAKISIDEIRSRYPDFAELQSRVLETVQNTALFHDDRIWQNPQTAVQALDDAYKLTKGTDLLAGTIPAEPGYDAAAAKRAAQTATGGNPRPETVNDQEQAWERIKQASEASYANLRKT